MLEQLKVSGRMHKLIMFFAICSLCFVLSVIRFVVTGELMYLFLNWNLFLSVIPWLLTTLIIVNPYYRNNKIIFTLILLTWFLFFPNSPYILTDLLHLKQRGVPLWFDLGLIFSFAWCGLVIGFNSLNDIENILLSVFSKRSVTILISFMLFVASFGVYLGRFVRWNSWDILSNGYLLLSDIGDRVINPGDHPRTWAMTILFGILLNIMYWTIRSFGDSNITRVKVKN